MIKLLVATNNSRKLKELKTLLKGFPKVKIVNYDDLEVAPPIIVEDGKTFRQNAIKKAITVSRFFDGIVLADDSGLEVDALGGKPGVRSARFARTKATDVENNEKLLRLLENTPDKSRKAQFVCHIALAREGHLLTTLEGIAKGKIAFEPKGKNGFGYDPVFVPTKYEKTFAEMETSFKNKISHRGLALKKLKGVIGNYLK